MICARCGSVMKSEGGVFTCPECPMGGAVLQMPSLPLEPAGMICTECGTAMLRDPHGRHYCYPCAQALPRSRAETLPVQAEFRALKDRLAKLESAVADLRRRMETDEERRLRKIRAALEARGVLPVASAAAEQTNQFLGETAEEPCPGEPDETR